LRRSNGPQYKNDILQISEQHIKKMVAKTSKKTAKNKVVTLCFGFVYDNNEWQQSTNMLAMLGNQMISSNWFQ
jgi:hypothetical protein